MTTVIYRCRAVATALGQKYVVLTVDEALHQRLIPLKWSNEDLQDWLVVHLGGLHTTMNFLAVIGRHVQMSGLVEVWTEASLFGDRTAQRVLATGKPYTKAIRGHTLTWQAMWRLLIPRLRDYMKQHSPDLYTKLNEAILVNGDGKTLEGLLLTQEFQGHKKAVQRNCGTKPSVLDAVPGDGGAGAGPRVSPESG